MEIELDTADATAERCLEALADERRRQVLAALCGADGTLSLTELAAELARADLETAEPDADRDLVRRRKTQLYHRHVPKLADVGLVEFDRDRRTVTLLEEFENAAGPTELRVT